MLRGDSPFNASRAQIVLTKEALQDVVAEVLKVGAFAFDVETRGVIDRHPDLVTAMEKEIAKKVTTLRKPTPDVVKRSTEAIEATYRGEIAVNPLRNEVFWIGIATAGNSWAIPMGHSKGLLLEPEEVGDGSTVPPPGYRKILKNGQESTAKARYHKPAVFSDPPQQLSRAEVFEALRPLFFSDLLKIGHNVKFDARSISKYYGEIPPGPYMDTMLLQHVVYENLTSYSLVSLIQFNYDHLDAYSRDGKLGKHVDHVGIDTAALYVHRDVRWTWLLYRRLWNRIKNQEGLNESLMQDCKTLEVLMHMENEGIPVDVRQLKNLGHELDKQLSQLLLDMTEYAPVGFNPDSNKHKQQFLFNKKRDGGLGLKPYKMTNGGAPSVDEESLRSMEAIHPMIGMLLKWAETKKLKSTYVEGLVTKLYEGKLHPSFHLHRTATGRLSSSDPNLQNIPRESSIRKLFIPPPGHTMLVADYDQIELRVMAMFSQDKQMVRIFQNNEDIHAGAAALLFDKAIDEVTDEERQIGKGANFLTAYGGGYMKLARTTGLDEKRAKYMIDRYYQQFSGITAWKQSVIAKGRTKGYVTTLSGRRRRLPDLTSSNDELRSRAERQAVNAVVQGSAADLCKQAMLDIYDVLKDSGAKMVVQVHDELVTMVPEDEVDSIIPLFIKAMGDGRVINDVPLKVSYDCAYSWADAK
jgi:DNA polymerase-1